MNSSIKNVSYFTDSVLNCSSIEIPSVSDYLLAKNIYVLTSVGIGGITLLLVFIIYIDVLNHILKTAPSKSKSYIVYVLSLYPATCFLCFITILIPRSYLLIEILIQTLVTAGIYLLYCLFISYCGGESKLSKETENTKISLKVAPCCCWFRCLPTPESTKENFKIVKYLVLQLPLIEGLLNCVLFALWMENPDIYKKFNDYVQIIITILIMLGFWGIIIIIEHLKTTFNGDFKLHRKFLVLQFILITSKLYLIFDKLYQYNVLPCHLPITPYVYSHLFFYDILIVAIAFLAVLARITYKNNVLIEKKSSICSIESTGINNNGFN